MSQPSKTRVEVALSPKHLALLDAVARERGCSRAEAVRELIRATAPQAVRS